MRDPSRATPRASTNVPSFGELYRRELGYVWTNLRRLGVPEIALEDAVHDVFVVVHRRLAHFEGRSTMRTWLFGIVRRIAARHRRTEARTQRRRAALAHLVPDGPDLDDAMALREAARALEAFLGQLDPRKREAFVLGELERLTRQELGRALGVSPNTAYSRLRAARAEFRSTFAAASPSARKRVLRVARSIDPPPPRTRKRIWLVLATHQAPTNVTKAALATSAIPTWGGMVALAGALVLTGWFGATSLPISSADESGPQPRRDVATAGRVDSMPSSSSAVSPASPADDASRARSATLAPASVGHPQAGSSRTAPKLEHRPAKAPTPSVSSTRQLQPSDTEPATASTLAEEAALLQQARRALRMGDHGETLRHLDTHSARFPSGALTEEREASRVEALCRRGNVEAARASARRFARHYPRSAHLDALRSTCAGREINSGLAGDQGPT